MSRNEQPGLSMTVLIEETLSRHPRSASKLGREPRRIVIIRNSFGLDLSVDFKQTLMHLQISTSGVQSSHLQIPTALSRG